MFLSFMTACMTAFSIIVIPLVALTHSPVHTAMCERLPGCMITLHLEKTTQGRARSGLRERNCHTLVMSSCVSGVNQTPPGLWRNKTQKHVYSLCISMTITRNVFRLYLAPKIVSKKSPGREKPILLLLKGVIQVCKV